jgi:hypothetical protein
MGNKRKLTYQSKGNQFPTLTLTGKTYLLHYVEAELEELNKGDVLFYLHGDTSSRERDNPMYDQTGGAGYLKAMVYDGKEWQFMLMDDIFAGREHHYAKTERPLDTYAVCEEVIAKAGGTVMQRKYRQHYEPLPPEETEE